MSNGKENELGLTPLIEAAVAMHEIFKAYIAGGFSEEQALRIVIALSVESLRQASGKKESDD